MFDQIVGEKTARKPFALAVSVSGQATVLGLAILFPLLHTQAVTSPRLPQIVPLLRPWAPEQHAQRKPATGRAPAKPGPRIFTEHALLQPPRIPPTVAIIDDAPSIESIPGSAAFSGTPDGVFGILPTQTALPPKPAPPPATPKTTPAVTPRLKIGGMVQAAKILRQVKPVYPQLAKQARVSGEVRLEAVISRGGAVESLQVLSGHPLLVPAALEAVRQWLYQPTLLNGDPVEVLTQIEVHFKLGE